MEFLRSGNLYALPALHYTMEIAAVAFKAIRQLKPDCIAVELPETMQLQFLHAASRLPDISIVSRKTVQDGTLYYLVEPCDASFEGLRSALEMDIPAFCIDLDIDDYPLLREAIPDPYAIQRIGLQKYYTLFSKAALHRPITEQDKKRELHMARRLKELSLRYDKVLFIGGMHHVQRILDLQEQSVFPKDASLEREEAILSSPTEKALREIQSQPGFFTVHYEEMREALLQKDTALFSPDRQKMLYTLFKTAAGKEPFPGYHLRNLMKFSRNYALITHHLLPDLFQTVTAAKNCVDPNYAYEVWKLATDYPYLKNIDQLPESSPSIEEMWGPSKKIRFELKQPGRKLFQGYAKRTDKSKIKLYPPGLFSICSYPPEDLVIENFGNFLKKKGVSLLSEEGARTIPFSTSLEEGIDTRETIRHFGEKKLYVKTKGKPPGGVGSVVVIFDEDAKDEKYHWKTTWIGEHNQESDMAFYATGMREKVIGPGIAECTYGGFLMSYPPHRLYDVWSDPDYETCKSKAEVLLTAAIDYAEKPLIVYVAAKPPRSALRSFARRYGKKIVYIPIGQLSPTTLNKLRLFHVLDSHDKRGIAGEYIN